jgi:hypothetical protein
MPNGGVPINLEFWMGDINFPGTVVFQQHSQTLKVLRVGDSGPRSAKVFGSIEITRPFLLTVVTHLLNPSSAESLNSVSSTDLSLMFKTGSLHLSTIDGTELEVLSGELLSVVAGFMAYWVDHDGVEVPTGLTIRYGSPIADAVGRNWSLNWAF